MRGLKQCEACRWGEAKMASQNGVQNKVKRGRDRRGRKEGAGVEGLRKGTEREGSFDQLTPLRNRRKALGPSTP